MLVSSGFSLTLPLLPSACFVMYTLLSAFHALVVLDYPRACRLHYLAFAFKRIRCLWHSHLLKYIRSLAFTYVRSFLVSLLDASASAQLRYLSKVHARCRRESYSAGDTLARVPDDLEDHRKRSGPYKQHGRISLGPCLAQKSGKEGGQMV